MPFNGSGTFSPAASPGYPAITGTTITSAQFNAVVADVATGLTNTLTRDGQSSPSADLPMATKKHTVVGDATARNQYASLAQVQDNTATTLASVAGTNTITAVAPFSMPAYATGQEFSFVAAGANTGAVTLNVNALGAKAVKKQGTAALVSGNIASGMLCHVVYDGTNFQLLNFVDTNTVASVKDYGALGDGSTDDVTAFNLAIAAINAGTITYLHIPKGTYVIGSALTAITADNWTIEGDGESSVLVMKTTVTPNTLSNFFTIGSTSVSADYWRISGLHFLNENTATMGTTNAIVIEQCTVGYIDHIHADDVAGFITLGTTSDTIARRVSVSNCKVEMYGPAAGTCFDIILAYVFSVSSVLVTMPTDGASAKGIHIHPVNDNVIDSHKWQGVEFNFPNTTIEKIFVMEATDGLIVNQWFDNCVFDHAGVACVSLLVGAGASANSRYHNIVFSNCRITARQDTTGVPVVIDVDTSREIKNVQFNGGTLIASDNSCVVITQIGQNVTSSFFGVGLLDGTTSTYPATSDRAAIISDLGNIKVIGCYADILSHVDACHFNYGVQFTSTAQDFIVSSNNFNAVTVADVDVSNLATSGQDNKIIQGNITPKGALPAKLQTTDATPAILISEVLDDASTYHVKAYVVGVKSDGTDRATYEITGTFYRTGGGNVTQVGTTTTVHSGESNASWAVAFSPSATTCRVLVTGVAGTTIKWVGKMEQYQITEA